MAGGEKTEQPTPKRLREARQKGQVALSRDVSSAAVLVVLCVYLAMSFDSSLQSLRDLIDFLVKLKPEPFMDSVNAALSATGLTILKLSLPPVLLAAAVGVAASYFQVGALLSFETIKPELNKLNPAKGIKKIFSMKNMLDFVKNLIKLVFISVIIDRVVREAIPELATLSYGNEQMIIPALGVMLKRITINACIAFIVIAAVDVFLTRRSHIKGLMMSHDEVKQEYKEMEGSPEIKGHRRQMHRELLAGDPVANTRRSTAVVTNPTHLAVAMFYKKGETPLPVIMAKGEGVMAELIKETARSQGIPIFENVPLARALYRQVDLGEFIPGDLIAPVAEIMRWAREIQLKQNQASSGAIH